MEKIVFASHKQSPFYTSIPYALSQLGYDVSIFDYYQPSMEVRMQGFMNNAFGIQSDRRRMKQMVNDSLVQLIDKRKPRYFFTTKALEIKKNTLQTLQSKGVICINWFQDLLEFLPWIEEYAPHYNYFFTPDPLIQRLLKKKRIVSHVLPLATNPDKVYSKHKKEYDVVFSGQWTKRRERLFSSLSELGDRFSIWGFDAWQTSSLKSHYKGLLPTVSDMFDKFRKSKLVINVQTAESEYPSEVINLRSFEATGVRTMLLNWYHPVFDDFWLPEREIIHFKTPKEALEKVTYYLAHDKEREIIAKRGWRRTVRDHTMKKRLEQLFSIVSRENKFL